MAVEAEYPSGLHRWSIPMGPQLLAIYHISGAPIVTGVILWVSLRILLHYAQNSDFMLGSPTLLSIANGQAAAALAIPVRRNLMSPPREFADVRMPAVS